MTTKNNQSVPFSRTQPYFNLECNGEVTDRDGDRSEIFESSVDFEIQGPSPISKSPYGKKYLKEKKKTSESDEDNVSSKKRKAADAFGLWKSDDSDEEDDEENEKRKKAKWRYGDYVCRWPGCKKRHNDPIDKRAHQQKCKFRKRSTGECGRVCGKIYHYWRICDICGFRTKDGRMALVRHQMSVHRIDQNGKPVIYHNCNKCDYKSIFPSHITQHQKSGACERRRWSKNVKRTKNWRKRFHRSFVTPKKKIKKKVTKTLNI